MSGEITKYFTHLFEEKAYRENSLILQPLARSKNLFHEFIAPEKVWYLWQSLGDVCY